MGRRLDSNVVLIGMPGVGKSTVGVLLAKALSREFVDTDVRIQVREGRMLQEIIDSEGLDAFQALEERHVLNLMCQNTVVATGGSVVYSKPAMEHLRAGGFVIHLSLPLGVLEQRLVDTKSRGLVIGPGQTIEQLYHERMPLYERECDITMECEGMTQDEVVGQVLEALRRHVV